MNLEGVVTYASQTINTDQTEKIDDFYGMESGVTTLHETLEAYVGGLKYPGTGTPTQDSGSDYENYLKAHNEAKNIDKRFVEPIRIEEIDANGNSKSYLYRKPVYDRTTRTVTQPKKMPLDD